MENPFFRNYLNSSRPGYVPNVRGIPVHQQTNLPSRKVVSVPVHFVESEKTRSASALKIQKFFRGFMVRKSMKKIITIKREVDEMEQKISENEYVDLIRSEAKELVKANETLMALLCRLDSVSGIDPGVRDCRRSVIRKAISLQEKVDAIVSGDRSLDGMSDGRTNNQIVEMSDETDLAESTDKSEIGTENAQSKSLYLGDAQEEIESTMESSAMYSENYKSLMEESEGETPEKEEDTMEIQQSEQVQRNIEKSLDADEVEKKNQDINRNLMQRMIEDNEKMMGLMKEIFERNELQTGMMNSLSQRIERLERAFRSKGMKREKKRQARTGTVEKRKL